MADSLPDDVLEFLRRNNFTKAEAALRSELGNRPDLNGILDKLKLNDKELRGRSAEEVNGAVLLEEDRKIKSSHNSREALKESSSAEASKELIVKEVECEIGRNGSDRKWKSCDTFGEQSMVNVSVGTSDKSVTFSKNLDDTVLDLNLWKYSTSNGPVSSRQNDAGSVHQTNFLGLIAAEALDSGKVNSKPEEDVSIPGERRMSWPVGTSKAGVEPKHDRGEKSELKEVDLRSKISGASSKDDLPDNSCSRSNASAHPSLELWKDSSLKTVFPFSGEHASTSNVSASSTANKMEGKTKRDLNDIKAAIKEQVDEVERTLLLLLGRKGEIFEEEKVEEEEVEVEEEEVEVEVEKVEVEEEVEVEEVKEESVEKVHKWLFKEEEDMTWETYRYCSNWNTIERSILMKTIHNFAKANCPKDYWKVRTWMNLSDTYNEMAVRSNQIKRSYHEIIGGGKYLQSLFTIERQRHFHENTPVDQILLDIFEPCNECRNRIPVFPKSLLYNGSTPSTSFGSRTDSSSHSKKQWTPDELELLKSTISDFSSASMPKPYWDVQLWTYLSETYNVQARFKNLNTVSYLEFIRGGMQLQSIFCEERLSNALHSFGSCGRDFVLMKIFEPCLECRKRIPVFPNGLPNNGFTSLASSSARSVQSHFTSYEDESYSATLNNMLIVVREMFEKGLLTSAQLSIVTFKLQDFAQSEAWKMCLLNNIFTLEMKREVLIQMCPEA